MAASHATPDSLETLTPELRSWRDQISPGAGAVPTSWWDAVPTMRFDLFGVHVSIQSSHRFKSLFLPLDQGVPDITRYWTVAFDYMWSDPAEDDEAVGPQGFGDNPRGTNTITFRCACTCSLSWVLLGSLVSAGCPVHCGVWRSFGCLASTISDIFWLFCCSSKAVDQFLGNHDLDCLIRAHQVHTFWTVWTYHMQYCVSPG